MGKLSHIIWNPIYNVNIEVLDAQHKKLFDVVNQHIDAYESGSSDFLLVIKDIVGYLSFNFHQEHMVMMHANYPDFLKHIKEHQQFTEKIEEFLMDYKEGDRNLGLNMMVFLNEWVLNHTANFDVPYGKYLFKNAGKLRNHKKLNKIFEAPVYSYSPSG